MDLTANRTAVLDQGGNYSTELFANVSIDRIRDYAATTAAAAAAAAATATAAAAAAAAVESSASTAALASAVPEVVASSLASPAIAPIAHIAHIAPTPFFLYLAMQVRRGDGGGEGIMCLLCRGCVVACVVACAAVMCCAVRVVACASARTNHVYSHRVSNLLLLPRDACIFPLPSFLLLPPRDACIFPPPSSFFLLSFFLPR